MTQLRMKLISQSSNDAFGLCDPSDPMACTGLNSRGTVPAPNLVCTQNRGNNAYSCLGGAGTVCETDDNHLKGPFGISLNGGYCASRTLSFRARQPTDPYVGKCGSDGKCTAPGGSKKRKRYHKRSIEEVPILYEKKTESRELLSVSEAVAMLAGHGVFEHDDVLIRDPSFMP